MFGKAALSGKKSFGCERVNAESVKEGRPYSRRHFELFLTASLFKPSRSPYEVFSHALPRLQI